VSTSIVFRVSLLGALAAGAVVGCSTVLDLDSYKTASSPTIEAGPLDGSADASADAIATQRSDWAQWPLPATYNTALDGATPVNSVPGSGVYTVPNLFTFYVPPDGKPLSLADARALCQARGAEWELPTRVELVALWDPRAGKSPYGPAALPPGPVWSQTLRQADGKRWVANFAEKGSQFLTTKQDSAYAICIPRGAK
jgi:hypothetical protein